ncbi:alpha/beta hydrolase [Paenibacillus rhizoplanae]
MALIECKFYSEVLGLSTSMTVILPQQTTTQIGMSNVSKGTLHPTLYLLHGLSDDDSIWLRRTSIERYVAEMGIAVVMPQVHRSFYTDMKAGGQYWTFISEELPALARSFFPLSPKREDNFVAGLSMGGYGAMKLGLRKPENWAAAASLSGALDMAHNYLNFEDSAQKSKDYLQVFLETRTLQALQKTCCGCFRRLTAPKGRSRCSISAVAPRISSMRTIRSSVRPAPRPSCL